MKVVNGTSVIVRIKEPGREEYILETVTEIVVTTLFYDDGRVTQQYGEGQDWIEIKEADKTIAIVGKCKDCGEDVYEDQIYNYHKRDNWVAHGTEEDCKRKDSKGTVGLHSVKPKDDK